MNCKPGDVAIVVGSSAFNGFIVDVLYAAPVGVEFTLPDGGLHNPVPADGIYWALRFMRPINAPTNSGRGRRSIYAVGADSKLRPLRDNDGEDEMIRIAGLPHKEHA